MIAIPNYSNISDLINHLNGMLADLYRQVEQGRGEVGQAKMFGDNGHRIINLPRTPLGENDAITKDYFSNNPSGYETHAAKHQDGGVDEINVGGLSGLLDDLQKPLDHAHESSGNGVGGKLDHAAAMNNLGWTVSGHTIADNEKVYAGDTANNNYFMYNSSTNKWEFYRGGVLWWSC
jgi:hypothetical protein